MNCINNYIRVRFDPNHNRVFKIGDIELIRVDKWEHKGADEQESSKFEENCNYLETKPQICEVIAANPKYPYKVGDKIFVHYMAWETAKAGEIATCEAFILAEFVFMTIKDDGSFVMADDTYIGTQVVTPEVVRPSGIIVDIGGKKEAMRVVITNIPSPHQFDIPNAYPLKSIMKYPVCSVGDTVVTIDRYNYVFKIDGKEYIRLKSHEIVGTVMQEAG